VNSATAIAHPNIALIKYWGKRDIALNLPAVSSLSMTLDGFRTRTTVSWGTERDTFQLNGLEPSAAFAKRAFVHLDRIDPHRPPCGVRTVSNFPTAAGLASSASGFAALTMAAAAASGQRLSATELSVLSRQGSGSACRSLWGGFVRWDRGTKPDGSDSHGVPLNHSWDLAMVVAVVSSSQKSTGSTVGMNRSAATSAFYDEWIRTSEADVKEGVAAITSRDLDRLGQAMERSTFKMHATMHSATPPLLYWQPETVAALHAVFSLRAQGISAWATMDAGPQVKVLCARSDAAAVEHALLPIAQQVHVLGPGPDAYLVPE
jgi:diphosphomevalonate decarboxylase